MTINHDYAVLLAQGMDGAKTVSARLVGYQTAPETPAGTFDTFLSQLIQGASDIHDLSGSLDYFSAQLAQMKENAREIARTTEDGDE